MKVIFLLLLLLAPSAFADKFESTVEILQQSFLSRPVSHEKHRGYVLHHGARTAKAIVLFHPLYESPKHIRSIAEEFYAAGFNVVVPILNGHWDIPLEKLDDATAHFWINETAPIIEASKELGETLYLGGASVGALLALYHAMKDQAIVGLALWSPALQLSTKVWFGSYTGWLLKDLRRLDGNWLAGKPPKDGIDVPYYSVAVGVEAARLGKQLISDYTRFKHPTWWTNADSAILYKSINIPVAIVATPADDIVSYAEIRKMHQFLGGPSLFLEYENNTHSSIFKAPQDTFPGSKESNPYFKSMMIRVLDHLRSKK
jgi:pimeloyl-ACP methyl ester carboxylesterase